jgi:ferric-dicitrate binding protein FerR (iron transport regulator)
MIRIAMFAIICVGCSALLSAAAETAAVVTRLDGTATVAAKGSKASTPLKKNDQILKGQEVRVGERSRIELKYPDGTIMRFAERSTIKMEDISYDSKTQSKKVKVDLGGGKLWANVKKLTTSDSRVEVKTVNAVAGVRGTTYRVNVDEDNSAMVKVYDGSVNVTGIPKEAAKPAGQFTAPVPVSGPTEVAPPYHEVSMEEWTVIVKAMQQVSISPQGVASKPQDFSSQQDMDDWVMWNQERDKQSDQ